MSHTDTTTTRPEFFSQHGEDIVAWKVLGDSVGPKFFVEVGMIDGMRFSNTLAFEKRGWKGLCVEAHPDYVDFVRRNRPQSTVVHAAAAGPQSTGKKLPFYADPRGDLSSLVPRDEETMKQRFGRWFKGYKQIEVPIRTLDDMLYLAGAPQEMELLSIDIEGGEMDALAGFTLDIWRPRMVIVEADDDQALAELNAYFKPQHYKLARRVGVNAIFTRTLFDAMRTRLVRIDQPVLHTAHPTDQTIKDEVVIPSDYETRSDYARRLIGVHSKAA